MANQAMVMVVMVIAVMFVAKSEGTTVYWWSTDGGCPGNYYTVSADNCQCFTFSGGVSGYQIDFDGEMPVQMYDDDGCTSLSNTFTTSLGYCGQYDWQSVKIGRCN